MNTITRADAVLRMLDTRGKFFSVTFTKKDGTRRDMTCRLRVKKHLKGGKQPYNPLQKGLITVFDVKKQAYRMVNVNTVHQIKVGGETFEVAEIPTILFVGISA